MLKYEVFAVERLLERTRAPPRAILGRLGGSGARLEAVLGGLEAVLSASKSDLRASYVMKSAQMAGGAAVGAKKSGSKSVLRAS